MAFNEPRLDAPIPGMSMTAELGARPWQGPPQYTTVDEAIEYYLERMSSDEFNEQLIDVMEMGIPLTDLANTLQLGNVMEGVHTIDVGMLVMPVLIEMMMLIGDSADVDYDTGLEKKRRKDVTRDTLIAKVSKELQQKLNKEKKDEPSKKLSIEDISDEETMEEPQAEEVKPKGLMGRRT